jgi:hypothetical protein
MERFAKFQVCIAEATVTKKFLFKKIRTGGVARVVERLLSKCSNPNTAKKKN